MARQSNPEIMTYTVRTTALGRMLVAARGHGVAALYLGDEDETLIAALADDHPGATLVRDDRGLAAWADAAAARVADGPLYADAPVVPPLDLAGTPFQRRVWEALLVLPAGEVCTYAELARAVGRPQAVRAVARGCATNPVSVLVPCHRVVRSDGTLGGYRWGLARKAALLENEGARLPA